MKEKVSVNTFALIAAQIYCTKLEKGISIGADKETVDEYAEEAASETAVLLEAVYGQFQIEPVDIPKKDHRQNLKPALAKRDNPVKEQNDKKIKELVQEVFPIEEEDDLDMHDIDWDDDDDD